MTHIMSTSKLRNRNTKFQFWKWLCWSFTQLKDGIVAATTPANQVQPQAGHQLLGGYRAVLFIAAADLDEYHKAPHSFDIN